jgi:hypothetical protein
MERIVKKRNGKRGRMMIQVKVFDYEHEKDLELEMNEFLKTVDEQNIVDIKYHIAAIPEEEEEQIYCFSAMVIYRKSKR